MKRPAEDRSRQARRAERADLPRIGVGGTAPASGVLDDGGPDALLALVSATVDRLEQGIGVFDGALRLVLFNRAFVALHDFPEQLVRLGVTFEELTRFNAERGEYGHRDIETLVRERVGRARRSPGECFEHVRPNGRILEVCRFPMDHGFVATYTDITERKHAEAALRDSEQRFRDIASASSDWFWEMGPDLRFTWFSEQVERSTGMSPSRLVGKTRKEVGQADPNDPNWKRHLADLEARRPFRDFRYRTWTDRGEEIHICISGVPVFDGDGVFRGYRGTGTNITAEVIAERKAAAAQARLEDATESIHDGFALFDAGDRLVLCNEAYREALHRVADILKPGVAWSELLRTLVERGGIVTAPGTAEQQIRKWTEQHRKRGATRSFQTAAGRWIEVREYPTADDGRVIIRTDITERKRAEAALRASERSLANAQRIAHLGNWDLDIRSHRLSWSDEIFRIFGHAPQAFAPTYDNFLEAVHPADRERVRAAVDDSIHRTKAYSIEHRIIRPDGSQRWVHEAGEVTFDDLGVPLRMTGTVHDITERKEAEDALRAVTERLHLAFETNPDAVTISRLSDGLYIDVNNGFQALTGYTKEEAIGRSALDLGFWADPNQRRQIVAALGEHGQIRDVEIAVRHKGGELRTALASASSFTLNGEAHLLAVTKDITELKKAEEELRKLSRAVEQSAAAVIITDAEGVIEYVNPKFTETTGYRREEVIGDNPRLLKSGDMAGDVYQRLWATIRRAEVWQGELCNRRKDGSVYWASASISPIKGTDGRITHFVGVQEDITARKIAEDRLRDSEERFRGLAEGSVLGIVIDRDGRPLFANQAYADMFGYASPAEILTLPSLDRLYAPGDVNRVRRYRSTRLEGSYAPEEYEFRGLRKEGSHIWVRTHVKIVRWGGKKAVQSTVVDITLRKHYEQRLHHQANFDPITELPNRSLALDRLDRAVIRARRHQSGLAVLFVDMDHFKGINDMLGHASGDQFLREVGERIRSCVREQDTVARLGGDEFVIILSDVRSAEDTEAVARKILDLLAKPFTLGSHETFTTASVGIAIWPEDGADSESLVRNADAAMYQAKQKGRNTVHFFTRELSDRALERVRVESHLRRAVEADEFTLFYQPLVAIRSGRVVGAEALLRWESPALGEVDPGQFVHLAEHNGLIVPIGQWVVRTVCQQLRNWQNHGLEPLPISVNISSRQLRGRALVDAVSDGLRENGLRPDLLELEITESLLMDELPATRLMIDELKKRGVRLAVDDFGTGYSSLRYLTQLPVDTLKIDKSFVAGLPEDESSAALVEAMVAIAHRLKLRVVAEGVENKDQLNFLAECACDRAQGFYYSRPLPADAFAVRLRNRKQLPAAAWHL